MSGRRMQVDQEAVMPPVEEDRPQSERQRSVLRLLQESPLADPDLDLERQDEMGREVKL